MKTLSRCGQDTVATLLGHHEKTVNIIDKGVAFVVDCIIIIRRGGGETDAQTHLSPGIKYRSKFDIQRNKGNRMSGIKSNTARQLSVIHLSKYRSKCDIQRNKGNRMSGIKSNAPRQLSVIHPSRLQKSIELILFLGPWGVNR